MNLWQGILAPFNPRRAKRPQPKRIPPPPKRRAYQDSGYSDLHGSGLVGGPSPNADIRMSLARLRIMAKESYQRSDHARAIVRTTRQKTIGRGMRLLFRSGLDDTTEQRIRAEWRRWSSSAHLTPQRRLDFAALQALAVNSLYLYGEVIALLIPYGGVEVLDPCRLDDQMTGRNIGMGIEFAESGAPERYYFRWHAGRDRLDLNQGSIHRIVPAERVIHSFLSEYPEQIRGVPLLLSADRLEDVREYSEAEIDAAVAASNKMAVVKRNSAGDGLESAGSQSSIYIEDREIFELPAGAELDQWNPDHPTSQYGAFVRKELEGVAAGSGASYQDISGDYGSANFSSIRASNISLRDSWGELQTLVRQEIVEPIFRHFIYQAAAAGKFGLQRPEHLLDHCIWTPRSWEHIQPREEAAAIDIGLKNHSITLSDAIRRQGRDPQEHFDEMARDQAQLQKLGLRTARRVSKQGDA